MAIIYLNFLQFLVRLAESDQHPGVVRSQLLRLLVVVNAVEVHFEELVGLTETVPGSIVPLADL